MTEKLVYTIRELADALQISLPTAYALTEREDFPVMRVGNKYLIPIADLERWMTAQSSKDKTRKAKKK